MSGQHGFTQAGKTSQALQRGSLETLDGEYVRNLRQRLKNPGKPHHPEIGEVVLVKSKDKNREKCKIGIVTDTIEGHDGVFRAVKLRVGPSRLKRAVQHLFPLELSYEQPRAQGGDSTVLRAEAPEFSRHETQPLLQI